MSPRRSGRADRRRRLLAALGALVVVAAAAVAFVLTRTPGDISHPNVEFRPEPPPPVVPPKATRRPDRFQWAFYGYSKDRQRYLPAPARLRPPFVRSWVFRPRSFLEFSPIIAGRRLFLLGNDGRLTALDKKTGRVRWRRRLGVLAAASPAYAGGRVCATVLARGVGLPGRVACLRASNGRTLWSRPLPSRSESSPVIDHGDIYFGSENGTVYALDVTNGARRWTYRAHGAVKGGLALAGGILYFGDYAGRVYAVGAADGRERWQVGTSGARLGFASGRFYSTPAVAYGRVYIGNADGFVYSFAAGSGRLAWRHRTGGYVYSSPAVAQVPGGRPTVYIGSYDGYFYALDARGGGVRWKYHDGGKISGGATIVGDIVYFSNIAKRTTTGLGARTGRVVFRSRYGAFNPVVSDTRMIFQTGAGAVYGLRPVRRRPARSSTRPVRGRTPTTPDRP